MKPLRAGLIGLGMMGRHHARILRQLDGVEFIGAVDPGGNPFNAALPTPVFSTVEELVRLKPDYCVVAVPTVNHFHVAVQLAERGIACLIEKPLAANASDAKALVELFESTSTPAAVGHIERSNAALRELRCRLEDGELGSLFQVATRRQGPFPGRISDAGVVLDLATHDLDLTCWVTKSDLCSVAAFDSHRAGRSHEDLVVIVGRLSDETVTSHMVNWISPFKERVTAVTGERGTFVADTLTADLTFYENGVVATDWDQLAGFRGVREGNIIRYAFEKPEPLLAEHRSFRDLVLGKTTETVSLREGLRAIQLAEAVLAAADSGGVVNLRES